MSTDPSPDEAFAGESSFTELLDRARGGCETALGQVLEACRPYLLLVANREVPQDLQGKVGASDLVQETFFRACREYARFRGESEGELRAWLRRILLNNIADQTRHFCRTGKRQVDREIDLANVAKQELTELFAEQDESPSARVSLDEQLQHLQRALERLPEVSRKLIQWKNFDRLTFKEIGARLGVSADVARKSWIRAIEQVQLPEINHEP